MNVSMTPELEKYVHAQVKSGRYQSASEVFRDGIRQLQRRDEWRREKIQRLNEEIQIGIDQAERGEMLTPAEAKKRLAAFKKQVMKRRGKI